MFETGAEGLVTLPVNAWLVRHPRGTVLFDAGMPASFVGGSERTTVISEFLSVGFLAGDTIDAQLTLISQDPRLVDFVVISHLHFDHVGGLSMIPNATVVIQRPEWEAGMTANDHPIHPREDFDLGHKLCLLDGEQDLFGDDTVVCVPTPGHTVGHQSLRVKLTTGEHVLLASDCCYFARTLDNGLLPTFGHDLDEQRRSIERVKKYREDGAKIIPGHDISVVKNLPRVLGV